MVNPKLKKVRDRQNNERIKFFALEHTVNKMTGGPNIDFAAKAAQGNADIEKQGHKIGDLKRKGHEVAGVMREANREQLLHREQLENIA